MADETTVTKNLWTEHLGKGFAAKQADYAIRASEDVNGTSLTLSLDSESDTVTRIGGKKISAKTAETDINGKSLELTVLNNERVTQIGGLTVGADAPDLTNYYHHRGSSNLNVALGNSDVGKLIQVRGNMNDTNVSYSIATDWGGVIRTLFQIDTTSANSSYFTFGTAMSSNGRRYLLPPPVANKYAKTNADGKIVWGDVPSLPSPSIDDSLLLGQSDGSKTWTALERDVFGTVMLDENDIPVLDESSTPDNPVVVYDADSTDELWTSFANHEFGARRAYEDQDGNNIKATYARKDEAFGLDEATEGEVDSIVITYGSVVIGGRTYKTVTIGNQEWLAENLDYKFEGLEIGEEDTLVKAVANYYDGDEATYGRYGNRYGLLYNWKAVDYIEQNKATLLPSDWHVPTETEWTTLLTAVGGASVAGEKLKSFSDWSSGNGDDPYGMSIYPCGDYSTVINEYENINVKTWFWTATESSASNNAKYVRFSTDDNAHQDSNPKSVGYSVRLVRTIS